MSKPGNGDPEGGKSPKTQSIIAKFGSTIQNVTQIINYQVNEQIVRRLGLEQRVGFIIVYSLVIVTAIFLFFSLRYALLPKTSTRMGGTFNIAVASFDTTNSDIFKEEDGVQIGNWIVEQLQTHKPSFPQGTVVDIWGPEQTGPIDGLTSIERAKKAQTIADKIGAHIVIYGSFQHTNNIATVIPEFLVTTSHFDLAMEITGPHEMGTPINVQDDLFENPVLSARINNELKGRTLALGHFTIGLIYYALDDYETAYAAFREAEMTKGWESDEGKEVIYLFLGNAALNFKDYETASAQFDKALFYNPDYSRAYIGRGFNLFQEAIQDLNTDSSVDLGLMNQAINAFKQGIDSTDKPENAYVDIKGHFGLGRSYLTLSVIGENNLWSEAKNELMQVTDFYESGNANFQELAAQAYGNLGLLHYSLGEYEDSVNSYEQALEIGRYPEFKSEWAGWLSKVYQAQGNKEKATEYSNLADTFK